MKLTQSRKNALLSAITDAIGATKPGIGTCDMANSVASSVFSVLESPMKRGRPRKAKTAETPVETPAPSA